MTKFITAAFVSTALLTTAAFAQAPSVTAPAEKPAASAEKTTPPADTSRNGTWRTSKMVGLSVYNDSNESIGSINELLTDDKGMIKAVVIGVGGFLGIGEHNVAVDYDKVKFVKEPMTYAGSGGGKMGAGGSASTTTTGAATGAAAGSSTQTAPAAKANPWYPDHAVYSATKDQLKSMPDIKYSTN